MFDLIVTSVIGGIISFVIGMSLEKFFGIWERINKFWHILLNAPVNYSIIISVKNKSGRIKDFYNLFLNSKKITPSKDELTIKEGPININILQLGNEFNIEIGEQRIGMNNLRPDLEKLLAKFEKLFKEKHFEMKDFSIKLILPYKKNYIKIGNPKNMGLEKYSILYNNENSILNVHFNSKKKQKQVFQLSKTELSDVGTALSQIM